MSDTDLNILVVDDEINIRKTLSMCLETDGHRVVAVSNYQDAVAEASRRSFEYQCWRRLHYLRLYR